MLRKNYEVLAGRPLDEDLGVTVITDLCVKENKGRLELSTKDMRASEAEKKS